MTATAAAPAQTARQAMAEQQYGSVGIDLNRPHFFVQMGFARLDADTPAVPGRAFLRGEITPVISFQQKTNLMEIREGDLIPGSEQADADGRVIWGRYWRHAHYEAERLRHNEATAEAKQGLVYLEDETGMLGLLYKNIDLNDLFYPNGLDNLPETNHDMLLHLMARRQAIKAEPPASVPQHILPALYALADQMVAAAALADATQKKRLDWTHTCMKLQPSDPTGNFKREYDRVDEEMLLRTGAPRVHAADVNTAEALKKLSEPQPDQGMLALAKALTEQNELMRQQMENERAERSRLEKELAEARNAKAASVPQTSQPRSDIPRR